MSNPNLVYLPTSYTNEIDIRQELLNTLFGTDQEIAKAEQGLLRHIRTDSNGKNIPCPCVDPVTGEPDTDYYCPVCLGEKFLWDEALLSFYRVKHTNDSSLRQEDVGLVSTDIAVFYIPYNTVITKYDKIVQVNLDNDGNLVQPIKRIEIWEITDLVSMRLDHGRIEFKKVFAHFKDTRYLNTP